MSSAATETVDSLLRPILEREQFTAWCRSIPVRPWTILRWRRGEGSRVHAGTVAAVAQRLRVSRERVLAAIAASRAAADR